MPAVHINNGTRPKTDGEMVRVVSQRLMAALDSDPGTVQVDLERIAKRLDEGDKVFENLVGCAERLLNWAPKSRGKE